MIPEQRIEKIIGLFIDFVKELSFSDEKFITLNSEHFKNGMPWWFVLNLNFLIAFCEI